MKRERFQINYQPFVDWDIKDLLTALFLEVLVYFLLRPDLHR